MYIMVEIRSIYYNFQLKKKENGKVVHVLRRSGYYLLFQGAFQKDAIIGRWYGVYKLVTARVSVKKNSRFDFYYHKFLIKLKYTILYYFNPSTYSLLWK